MQMLHGLLCGRRLHVAKRDIAGGVDEDAGECGGRIAKVGLYSCKGRGHGVRRRDVALVCSDAVVYVFYSGGIVPCLEQFVATVCFKRGVENGETTALLEELLACDGAYSAC